ncbi:hypothetical protein GHK33_22220 [Sinorhizobium meliloti]|uniref:hypothetical protein n=1 Tax=Rhizobium meliloti TaxID=382 RepID=UPI001296C141|nr:hypothetical protein [Sinorhizobium meliloti]MQW65242.1 hypothetical protein [Sinorhizobium meliloti]
MTLRAINQKYLAPGAQLLMIFGIIALCQPWNLFLHRYGLTMTLVGLIAFMITSKVPPEQKADEGRNP